jgi:hypothetical protein
MLSFHSDSWHRPSLRADERLETTRISSQNCLPDHQVQKTTKTTISILKGLRHSGNTKSKKFFYPASFINILSISAVDHKKNHVTFLTHNHMVDLTTPGVGIPQY